MIQKFATPLGENAPDEQVLAKFREATQSIIVDGALQKTAQVLATSFCTRTVLICRDPAHMVRIAVSEPLSRTGRFRDQHRRLFAGRHALIKDIQYSEVWQARLEAAQSLVLTERGRQEGGVSRILRHFSFAKHRWESLAGPRRQYACLLNAIFVCLAGIYNDTRNDKAKRDLARECLDAMTARDILECGVAGDYSEMGMRWARTTEWSPGPGRILWGGREGSERGRVGDLGANAGTSDASKDANPRAHFLASSPGSFVCGTHQIETPPLQVKCCRPSGTS